MEKGLSAGLIRVELADTIGIGNPRQVALVFSEVKTNLRICSSAHMHDTRNNGIINILTLLKERTLYIHPWLEMSVCTWGMGNTQLKI